MVNNLDNQLAAGIEKINKRYARKRKKIEDRIKHMQAAEAAGKS